MIFDSKSSAVEVQKNYPFEEDYTDIQKLVSSVDHVFIGEVLREDGVTKSKDGVETQFIVGITQNVKGALLGEIKVRQKGGYYKQKGKLFYEQYEKDPLLKVGQMYMFAATFNKENEYFEVMPKYGSYPLNSEEQKYQKINEIQEALK